MDALLTAIVLWLSLNFDLPATYDHPKIEVVPVAEIIVTRYKAFTPEARREVLAFHGSAASGKSREVVAVYDDAKKTILLPEGWSGQTPAELSVLVHEVVHHLQKAADLKYECATAREKLAYAAQDRWLGLFGLSLAGEFDIDAFTLKVSTSCGY